MRNFRATLIVIPVRNRIARILFCCRRQAVARRCYQSESEVGESAVGNAEIKVSRDDDQNERICRSRILIAAKSASEGRSLSFAILLRRASARTIAAAAPTATVDLR